jgi:hypothetical protein
MSADHKARAAVKGATSAEKNTAKRVIKMSQTEERVYIERIVGAHIPVELAQIVGKYYMSVYHGRRPWWTVRMF